MTAHPTLAEVQAGADALERLNAVEFVSVIEDSPRFDDRTHLVEVGVPGEFDRVPPTVLRVAGANDLGLWPDGCGSKGDFYVVTFR